MNKIILLLSLCFGVIFATTCDMPSVPTKFFKPNKNIDTYIYQNEICVGYEPGSKKPGKVILQTYTITTFNKNMETHFTNQITNVDCYCRVVNQVENNNTKLGK